MPRLPNQAPESAALADDEPLEAIATEEGATENEPDVKPAQGEEQVNPTPQDEDDPARSA